MKRRLFKYKLDMGLVNCWQRVEVGAHPHMLSVGLDAQGNMCVWAMVDDTPERTSRAVHMWLGFHIWKLPKS